MATRNRPAKKLTPLETLIMNVLWDESPAAVRQVQERLMSVKPMAYNTVLTIMRILRDKGFVVSEREGRSDLYRPVVTREDMGRRSLGEIIDSFFSGSAESAGQPTAERPSAQRRGVGGDSSGVRPSPRAQKRKSVMNTALNGLGSLLFGGLGQLSIELAVLAVLVLVASRLFADQVAGLAPPVMGSRAAQAAHRRRGQLALYAIHTVRATRGTQSGHPRILACRVPNDARSGFSNNCHK